MSTVRITVDVYGRPFDGEGDEARFGVTMNNEPLRVDIDLSRCDRCAALTLPEDWLTHEIFHDALDGKTAGGA